MHILFELTNTLSRESVRNSLTLPGVLSTVSSVEQPSLDGNEGIIVFTAKKKVSE